ncbi:GNAT family N-acetyltransferase [Spiroplasma endosymbiont of Panorpa germanica]|uniref:GNAT family N-acetyltransferase n=1 Tax=Spiroplasma endosymbiont of Panorpa germanica TaxID=3066314 RepID=UPI0030D49215
MFKFKNHYNDILVNNFISFNNDPDLNQGLIKKTVHESENWLEVDSSKTNLKINFLYSKPLLTAEDKNKSKSIIEKYTKLGQNIIWVMLSESKDKLSKDQFQELKLDYEVTYEAMIMKLSEAVIREFQVPAGYELKKLEPKYLNQFIDQIDDGFGKGVIDTTKYATILKMNNEQNICEPIFLYHDSKIVATGNIYFGSQACVIDDITVNSNYRGKGLASIILYELLSKARTFGCENLLLVATKDGLPIYKKMGFQKTGLNIEIYETRN